MESQKKISFPKEGLSKEEVIKRMEALRNKDANWRQGKTFSLVFFPGDEVLDLLKEAYMMFFSENGLNPTAFPSLKQLEKEVVAITADLLHGDEEACGNMTSGGTESILMAVYAARERARHQNPQLKKPQLVLPVTAHPAFEKAAHYFDIEPVHVPVGKDFRAVPEKMEKAVTRNTILMVASAPSYPHGVVDPIPHLGEIARKKKVLFHVDACMGGFLLPFAKKLGFPIPDFDFSVPGVTSISVDLHKYGYAAKGASVILYRSRALRRYQFFVYPDWPGGIYGTPTMRGTRPGGAIAAAWAILNYLGEKGYLELVQKVMEATQKIIQGIRDIPGLHVISNPDASLLAIGSKKLDIYRVGDAMQQRGWHLDRQQHPPSLHLTVSLAHFHVVDAFLSDLREAVQEAAKWSLDRLSSSVQVALAKGMAKVLPEKLLHKITSMSSSKALGSGVLLKGRSAAMYGMMGSLPNRKDIKEAVLDFMNSLY